MGDQWITTERLEQNGCRFADNILKCIFVRETFRISIQTSVKYVMEDTIGWWVSIGSGNGLAPDR